MFVQLQKLNIMQGFLGEIGLCCAGEGSLSAQTGLSLAGTAARWPGSQPDSGVTDSPERSFWRDAAGPSGRCGEPAHPPRRRGVKGPADSQPAKLVRDAAPSHSPGRGRGLAGRGFGCRVGFLQMGRCKQQEC